MNSAELKETLRADLFRYGGKVNTRIFLRSLLFIAEFRFTYILRKNQYYKQNKRYIIHYIFYQLLFSLYSRAIGCDIPCTTIGRGLYLGHIWGILVHPQAVIGCNVNIHRGVIIGKADRGEKAGEPTIGNRVYIGSYSAVVGKIHIGDNVMIAPGAFVNFDVPANSIVVGNPGKIIPSMHAVEGYVNNTVKED